MENNEIDYFYIENTNLWSMCNVQCPIFLWKYRISTSFHVKWNMHRFVACVALKYRIWALLLTCCYLSNPVLSSFHFPSRGHSLFLQCCQYIIHQWELKQTTNTCHLSRHKEILWKMGTFAYNDFLQYSQIHMCDCVIDFVDILGILMAPKLLVYGVNSNGTLCHSGSQMVGQGPKGFS